MSRAATMPALPRVSTGNASLDRWIQAVSERLEVREGSRGDPLEKVVTQRDLEAMGMSNAFFVSGGLARGLQTAQGGVLVQQSDGSYASVGVNEFAERIRDTKLYKDLIKRLDDQSRFDGLPSVVRDLLLGDIAVEAAKRGAEIRRLENALQNASNSYASSVMEVTSAFEDSVAGVRQTVFAFSDAATAAAGEVTQVQARINGVAINPDDTLGVGGAVNGTAYADLTALQTAVPVGVRGKYYKVGTPVVLYHWNGATYAVAGNALSATLEQAMTVSVDRAKGVEAQYTVKVNAGDAVAGFGIAAVDNLAGGATSAFIVQADTFALTSAYNFAQVGTPSATAVGQTWYNTTSKLSYRSTATGTGSWVLYTPVVPFGVDTLTGTVYINGNVRINSGGAELDSITAGLDGANTLLVYAFRRSASAPGSGPGSATFTFSTKTLSALANSWTATIPGGTDPLYVTTAVASSTTDVATIGASDWSGFSVLSQNGTDGLNVAVAELFQRTATSTPPSAQANTVTFTFATGGMTGMSAGWTAAVPSSGGGYLWTTRASASAIGTTDAIAAGEWSSPVLVSQDGATGSTGSTGATGTRGTRQLYLTSASYTAGYGAANYKADATAAIATAVSGSTPTTPIKGDTVTFTNGTSYTTTYTCDGTYGTNGNNSWVLPGVVIDGSLLVTGSVTATALSATAIDAKMITGSTLRTATTGARAEIFNGDTSITGYDAGSNQRVKIECSTGRITLNTDSTYGLKASLAGSASGSKAVYGLLEFDNPGCYAVYGEVSYSLTNAMVAGGFIHAFSGYYAVLGTKDYGLYVNGPVRFGTHTGGGDTTSNGYITIVDSGGTTRKLMTTA